MEKIAALVDDASQALQVLQPLAGPHTHWVLVGCAPKLTHRVSKWVSHSSREQWRARWATQLFAELLPKLGGARVDTLVARRPLPEVVQQLQQHHGVGLRVIDARRARPELLHEAPPVSFPQGRWTGSLALALGLNLALALGD